MFINNLAEMKNPYAECRNGEAPRYFYAASLMHTLFNLIAWFVRKITNAWTSLLEIDVIATIPHKATADERREHTHTHSWAPNFASYFSIIVI